MDKIIQEKISADHLLYVSLKYTKTADVILNLIKRWTSMIEVSITRILEHAKKKKRIKIVPIAPKIKVIAAKKAFRSNKEVIEGIKLYEFFKRVPNLNVLKEHEFRKNVTLKVKDGEEWIDVNLEKLKEYSITLENFISKIKQILSK